MIVVKNGNKNEKVTNEEVDMRTNEERSSIGAVRKKKKTRLVTFCEGTFYRSIREG